MSSKSLEESATPHEKIATFSVEAALLEELGERLVAVPEVALTELIKNSYDADADECVIGLSSNAITIKDDGNGMTEDDFLDFWMVIGTKGKVRKSESRKYRRKVSGSKGIGRFAVRFLGLHLSLETTSFDEKIGLYTKIEAEFDWTQASQFEKLSEIQIPYKVTQLTSAQVGTLLTISQLRPGVANANTKKISTDCLALTSPIKGLERPSFIKSNEGDPGFSVSFPSETESEEESSIQKNLLDAYVARARVEVIGDIAKVLITFDRGTDTVFRREINLKDFYPNYEIGSELFIDIRYFPQRKGTFSGLEGLNGTVAKRWLKENSGVAIIDNGFRIHPYGTRDDDWLQQNADNARNVRDKWRSKIMCELFPLPSNANEPRNNPLLYLPGSGQVYGAVFVATSPKNGGDSEFQLTPSMDRQGYLVNKAFNYVRSLARFCLEIIAFFDHQRIREIEEQEVKQQLKEAEEDLKSAITEINASQALPISEKARLTSLLTIAASGYKEADDYRKKAQESLETMSLLGVLAGFMTHEFEQTIYKLDQAIETIKVLSKKYPQETASLDGLIDSKSHLEAFLNYSKLFTSKLGSSKPTAFLVEHQIQFILETLDSVSRKHDIEVDLQVDVDLEGPEVPLSAYSGILLNLVTNAFKALISKINGESRKVRIIASSNGRKHTLIVADNGVGIPKRLQKRIWEPLFTTTNPENNPMGSGMGLGLAIVQRVVSHVGGKIRLSESPPPGFVTAFEVEFPT